MNFFSIFQLLLFLLFIGYLVYHYSMKSVSMWVKVTVYLSWILSFGFVFILPLDIYIVSDLYSLAK